MWPRTKFLSRLIGSYCILVALSMITHKQATIDAVTALVHSPALMFAVGVIALIAALAMVLGHNVWSGGTLPVIVTLVGWLLLVKSLLILFLSPEGASVVFIDWLDYEHLFYLYAAFCLLLGVYLTYTANRVRPLENPGK